MRNCIPEMLVAIALAVGLASLFVGLMLYVAASS